MQCNDIRELLSAHLDGVLEPSDYALVDVHLASCTACARELEDLQMVAGLLRELPEISPPPDFRSELGKRIDALATPRPVKKRGVLSFLTGQGVARKLAVAATFLVVAGVTAVLYGNPGQWGQKDVRDIILSGKNVAILNKEIAAGADDAQYKYDVVAEGDNQQLQPDNRDGNSAAKQKNTDNQTYGSNSKADENGSISPGAGLSEDERLYVTAAPSGGADSLRPENMAAPQAFTTGEETSSPPQAKLYSLQAEPRKTVRQAEMNLTVDNPDQTAGRLSDLARSRGGSIKQTNPEEQLFILSVPVENFNDTMDDLGKIGATEPKITEEDITVDYSNTINNLTELEKKQESLAPAETPGKYAITREIDTKQDYLRDLEDAVNNAIIKIKISKKASEL